MNALEPRTLFANRFEIERAAGSGGMGTVYRARDLHTGDRVALKLMQNDSAAGVAGERFAREARLLAEIRHPGIVAHVAHGQAPNGQRYLAMEWLEGEDLAARLVRGPLSIGDSVALLRRVAEALAVAHAQGVVHRDLKPSNLFLVGGAIDRVKVLDFGLARRVVTSLAMTGTGLVLGTPEYMAPEQARGDGDITPATDVFSLGCVLYECLAGQAPFTAAHFAAVLTRILFVEPRPIQELCPRLPDAVAALLGQMLAKERDARLPDARALAMSLAALAELPEVGAAGAGAVTVVSKVEAAPQPMFAEKEQGLLSLVLALAPHAAPDAQTMLAAEHASETEQRAALRRALDALGAQASFLVDGSLLVTVPPAGSATDQAAHAARAALVIKERWPAAGVALCTGRGAMRGHTAAGEVVDRATQLLQWRPQTPSGLPVDKLSAQLLGARFVLASSTDGAVLIGEAKDVDASRPLLGKPTPCVGREAELALLEAQLGGCVDGSEARAVLVTAPPGTGKSRLRHELLRRIDQRADAVTVLVGRGDAMSSGTPYGILRKALSRIAGIAGGEEPDEQRERIERRFGDRAAPGDRRRVVDFIGEVCGVHFPGEASALLESARNEPKIMRGEIRRAFADWLRAECAEAPVMLVLDDLHWGDALTVGVVDHALRELADAPLFVLGLARPEVHETFPKMWQGHNVQHVALRALGKKACERLVREVLGKAVPAADVARIVEQSAGNALFLEELIRAVAEGETDARPETVVAMLQARIGRFESGPRRALLAASVLGQTFWRGGVEALLGLAKGAAEVSEWLDALTSAELIERHAESRLRDEREHGFRHALVRDAAYALLAGDDLARGHRLAGAFLEAAGEADPLAIAEHFERSGDRARAVPFHLRAAEQALEGFDLEGALSHVERGIRCGAEGEMLGALRGVECSAWFRLDQVEKCIAAAAVALPLLRPGSRAWARVAWASIWMGISGPKEWRKRTPELVMTLVLTEPDVDARPLYGDALCWIITHAVGGWPRASVQPMLDRLDAIVAQEAPRNPAARRWQCAHSHTSWHCEPRPWTTRAMADEAIAWGRQAGDLQLTAMIDAHEGAMSTFELGDADGALARLRAHLEPLRLRQEMQARGAVVQQIALVLSQRGDAASLDEAERLAREQLEGDRHGLFVARAHENLARVKLARGEPAEADARKAHGLMKHLPLYALGALATLVRALVADGRFAEAVESAVNGLEVIRRFSGAGGAEVEMRLAASEAFHAAGDADRARAELAETLRQIALRAEDIADPEHRQRYVEKNPDNARARELARTWGV